MRFVLIVLAEHWELQIKVVFCRFYYERQTENAYELIATNKLQLFPVAHQHINKRNK